MINVTSYSHVPAEVRLLTNQYDCLKTILATLLMRQTPIALLDSSKSV